MYMEILRFGHNNVKEIKEIKERRERERERERIREFKAGFRRRLGQYNRVGLEL